MLPQTPPVKNYFSKVFVAFLCDSDKADGTPETLVSQICHLFVFLF
jgi:hypothetical protein